MKNLLIAFLALAPLTAMGHGIQVPIDVVDGRIATRSFVVSYEGAWDAENAVAARSFA